MRDQPIRPRSVRDQSIRPRSMREQRDKPIKPRSMRDQRIRPRFMRNQPIRERSVKHQPIKVHRRRKRRPTALQSIRKNKRAYRVWQRIRPSKGFFSPLKDDFVYYTQPAHNVVSTSIQRYMDFMDVRWTLDGRCFDVV